MHVFVTGVAGFIGSRVAEMLLDQARRVCGVDNMCAAYDLRLKNYRLDMLSDRSGLDFHRADIADWESISTVWNEARPL
jgi:nucleoside-diphosphate-sugar epimerase